MAGIAQYRDQFQQQAKTDKANKAKKRIAKQIAQQESQESGRQQRFNPIKWGNTHHVLPFVEQQRRQGDRQHDEGQTADPTGRQHYDQHEDR